MDGMTQKERIDQLLERHGLKQIDLLIQIYQKINPGANDSYEAAQKNKANFNKMILGQRPFKVEYIAPMEEILGTSFCYIINGEKKAFVNDGIRYAAFQDDSKGYALLDTGGKDSTSRIITHYDEYNKTILDYILQYRSKSGLVYLIKHGYLILNCFGEKLSNGKNGLVFCKEQDGELKVLKFTIEIDDPEAFEIFTNSWKRKEETIWFFGILKEGSVLDKILQSKNIFDYLLKEKELPLGEVNSGSFLGKETLGLFCNPLLFHLTNYALIHAESYPEQIRKLLTFGIKYNQKAIKYIQEHFPDGNFTLDDEGNLNRNNIRYSSLFLYRLEQQPNLSEKDSHLLAKLNNTINDFKFSSTPLKGGYSKSGARLVNGMVVKKSTKNKAEYEFLGKMKEKNIPFVPRLIKQQDGLDYFSYFAGTTESVVYKMPWEKIESIVVTLRKLNDTSKEILKDGHVYVHGDLSQMNVVFKDNKVVGIIDWDSVHIGEEYEDLVYVMWTWLDIGWERRENEKIMDGVKKILDLYRADEKLRKNWAKKMKSVMENRLAMTKKEDPNYERIFTWVRESEIWVELYTDRMNKEIG